LVEDDGLVPTSCLGEVERSVGLTEEIFSTSRLDLTECNPEAPCPSDVMTADLDRLCEQIQELVGDGASLVLVDRSSEKEDELIACETSDEIARAHPVAQTLPDGNQQAVPGDVAEEIVHSFEPVQVE
jgi:hypothetical protein